jgi:hypothetical protein
VLSGAFKVILVVFVDYLSGSSFRGSGL